MCKKNKLQLSSTISTDLPLTMLRWVKYVPFNLSGNSFKNAKKQTPFKNAKKQTSEWHLQNKNITKKTQKKTFSSNCIVKDLMANTEDPVISRLILIYSIANLVIAVFGTSKVKQVHNKNRYMDLLWQMFQ